MSRSVKMRWTMLLMFVALSATFQLAVSRSWLSRFAEAPVAQAQSLDCGVGAVASGSQRFLDCNPDFALSASDWPGSRFSLLQHYPADPGSEPRPWKSFDPYGRRSPGVLVNRDLRWEQADGYARAALDYALEGSITSGPDADVNFGRNTTGREWYHAPWLHYGCTGREPIHGLTRELASPLKNLYPTSDVWTVENWAVSVFNRPGGFTIGRVWSGGRPDLAEASFPDGTVAVKLLFTTATEEQMPFLKRSPVWMGHIFQSDGEVPRNPCTGDGGYAIRERVVRPLRLLQVDVAVRDDDVPNGTGWVFGTFLYDQSRSTTSGWDQIQTRLVPVGVMWGTDPGVHEHMLDEGAPDNAALRESVINPDLPRFTAGSSFAEDAALLMNLGMGGRLNGPVDNTLSACMSCHGRSGAPREPMVPPRVRVRANYPTDCTLSLFCFDRFFANIPAGAESVVVQTGSIGNPQDVPVQRTDYALQLTKSARLFFQEERCRLHAEGCFQVGSPPPPPSERTRNLTREGDSGVDEDSEDEP